MRVYDNASELHNGYLGIYFDQYMALPDAEKRKFDNKYEPKKSTDKEELTESTTNASTRR